MSRSLYTKTESKFVQPGSFLSIENGIYTDGLRAKKRNGYRTLGSNIFGTLNNLNSGTRLGVYNNGSGIDELLQFSNNTLYSYNQSQDNWINKGELVGCTVSEQTIFRNTYQQTQVDMDTLYGITVYAWNDTRGGIRCSVFDENENNIILNDALVNASGEKPRVLATSTGIFIFHIEGTNIKYAKISIGSPSTIPSLSLVISDLTADKNYDVTSNGSNMVMAYSQTGNNVKLVMMNAAGTVSAVGLPAPITVAERALNSIGIYSDSMQKIYVAYHNTTNGVRCFARDSNFAQIFSPVTLDSDVAKNYVNITGATSGTVSSSIRWYYEQSNASTYNQLIKTNTITTSGTAGSTSVFLRSVGLASKAFIVGSSVFVNITYSSTLQPTYFTISETGRIFTRIIPGQSGGLTNGSVLPKITLLISNKYAFPNTIVTKIVTQNNTNYTTKGVNRTVLNFNQDSLYQSLQGGL